MSDLLATLNLARSHVQHSRYSDAIDLYRDVLSSEGFAQLPVRLTALAFIDAGYAYLEVKQFEKAIDYFERSQRLNAPCASICCAYGEAFSRLGQFEQALALFEAAVKSDPEGSDAQFRLTCVRLRLGRHAGTDEPACADDPFDVWDRLSRGNIALAQGRIQEAARHFCEAAMIEPNSPHVFYSLGLAAMQSKNYAEAEEYFMRTLGIIPNDADALYGLAVIRYETNRDRDAVAYLKAVLVANPYHAEASTALLQLLIKSRQWLPAMRAALADSRNFKQRCAAIERLERITVPFIKGPNK